MSGVVEGGKKLLSPSDIGHDHGDGSATAHASRLIEDPTYRATIEKLYGKDAVSEAIKRAYEGLGPK